MNILTVEFLFPIQVEMILQALEYENGEDCLFVSFFWQKFVNFSFVFIYVFLNCGYHLNLSIVEMLNYFFTIFLHMWQIGWQTIKLLNCVNKFTGPMYCILMEVSGYNFCLSDNLTFVLKLYVASCRTREGLG